MSAVDCLIDFRRADISMAQSDGQMWWVEGWSGEGEDLQALPVSSANHFRGAK